MYAWYNRIQNNGKIQLTLEEEASLAGCNHGLIVNELREIIRPIDDAPFGWVLPIADKWNKDNYSFIVDIKPKKKDEIFLCELDRVFGYCYKGWTPIMLRLIKLSKIEGSNKRNFIYPEEKSVIYTMYYLYGSVENGKITGTWNPPFGTITALLFWPEAMTFFFEQVKKFDSHFLNADIKLMEI